MIPEQDRIALDFPGDPGHPFAVVVTIRVGWPDAMRVCLDSFRTLDMSRRVAAQYPDDAAIYCRTGDGWEEVK